MAALMQAAEFQLPTVDVDTFKVTAVTIISTVIAMISFPVHRTIFILTDDLIASCVRTADQLPRCVHHDGAPLPHGGGHRFAQQAVRSGLGHFPSYGGNLPR